mgnify:CR=1 FL=1
MPVPVVVVPGADHFFHRRLHVLRAIVRDANLGFTRVQFDLGEARAREACAGEVTLREDGSSEARALEAGPGQAAQDELGAVELASAEVGLGEARHRELRAAEVRVVEHGLVERALDDLGLGQSFAQIRQFEKLDRKSVV